MSIVKRHNSPYWYIQFQLNGQSYIRSARTTNRKAAEQMEVEWKALLHGQQFLGHKPDITVREAIEEFCASKKGTPNHRNLMYFSRPTLAALPVNKHLADLTATDLEKLRRIRQKQGASPQTIKHCINLVRSAWKYAKSLGYRVNELEFPVIKQTRRPLRYLTREEESRLLAVMDPQREGDRLPPYAERSDEMRRNMQDAYDLVILLLDTAARYSEVANIEWSRIDLSGHIIRLWRPKVQNEGLLYMTDRVHTILTRRQQEDTGTYVFQNRAGGPRGYVVGSIRKAIKRAGLADVTIHTLRHTHATRLIQNGLSVYEVREVLGHTDIKTTMRYAHLESRQVTSKARDVINQLNRGNTEPLMVGKA